MVTDDVRKAIEAVGYEMGDKLPSVRQMAKQLGVSVNTVQKAYKSLESSGRVKTYQGKGCFWGGLQEMTPQIKDVNAELLDQFARDLENGYLNAFDKLPSIKELSIRYKVSVFLIRKFLNHQVAKGILRRTGIRYLFNEEQVVESYNYVVFVHRADEKGNMLIESEREIEVFRALTRFVSEQKIRVQFIGYNVEQNRLLTPDGREYFPKEYPHCLGVFISTWLVQKPTVLFAHFAKLSLPISVWWEHASDAQPVSTKNRNKWAFFNLAFGKEVGIIVGRYLLAKNMKKVHFLSPFHGGDWSVARLTGIEECGIEVLPLVYTKYPSPFEMVREADQTGRVYDDMLDELIENLLKGASLDRFVCANDWVAWRVIEVHKKLGLPRPYVLGFDNASESFRYVFDSFAFNVETMVNEALYHITSPSLYATMRNQVQNPHGKVVEKRFRQEDF